MVICVNIKLVIIWLTLRSAQQTQYILSPLLYICIGIMPILHILKIKSLQAVDTGLSCAPLPPVYPLAQAHRQVCGNLMLAAQAL